MFIPEDIVESAGAALVSAPEDIVEELVSMDDGVAALVSVVVEVVVVVVEGGGFDASDVVSELLLQPTSVNGKAMVTATMGEYFLRKLFIAVIYATVCRADKP